MSSWGAATYGDPCRECGFDWSISFDTSVRLVADAPTVLGTLLAEAAGDEQRPDLTWSTGAYVCHVADNLRIWAERLVGVASGGRRQVGGYDENELAAARRYELIPLGAAQWSLGRSVHDWLVAVSSSSPIGTIMVHPDRGDMTLRDVSVANAHDAFHHTHDIRTILADNAP